jgi:hypothetical protein
MGGLGGLVVFNWLMLASCVWAGARFARVATDRSSGWVYGVVFIAASVVPIFAAWLTSEIFNFWLVFWAYFFWLYKKVAPPDDRTILTHPATTMVAVALIGFAIFSKATNAALAGPILLDLLFQRRLSQVAVAGLVLLLSVSGLFGVNALVTGEANYQGAEDAVSRRSFYDLYPFDDVGTRSMEPAMPW